MRWKNPKTGATVEITEEEYRLNNPEKNNQRKYSVAVKQRGKDVIIFECFDADYAREIQKQNRYSFIVIS